MSLLQEAETIGEAIVKDVEGVLSDVAKALAPVLVTAFEAGGEALQKAATSGNLASVGAAILGIVAAALTQGETAAIVAGSADVVGDITSAITKAVAASPAASAAAAATTPAA